MNDPAIDVWHFVYDDKAGTWTWQRTSPNGEPMAMSAFSFQSFNGCLADAERSGYIGTSGAARRVRAADLASDLRASHFEGPAHNRRRRPRVAGQNVPERRSKDHDPDA